LAVVAQALVILAEAPRGMVTSAEIADLLDVHPVVLRRRPKWCRQPVWTRR
jgi:DNA-binding IscR family transcriptional regulator